MKITCFFLGTPGSFNALFDELLMTIPASKLAAHCHDTYGQALPNILTALERGIQTIDSSVAGLGGCPYAAGASGNVATEGLVYMLDGMGIKTGVNFDKLIETGLWITEQLKITHPASKVLNAKAGKLKAKKCSSPA